MPAGILLALVPAVGRSGGGCCRRRCRAAVGGCAVGAAADIGSSGRGGRSSRRGPAGRRRLPAQQRAEPRAVLHQLPAAPSCSCVAGRGAPRRGPGWQRRRHRGWAAHAASAAARAGCSTRRAFPIHRRHERNLLSAGAPSASRARAAAAPHTPVRSTVCTAAGHSALQNVYRNCRRHAAPLLGSTLGPRAAPRRAHVLCSYPRAALLPSPGRARSAPAPPLRERSRCIAHQHPALQL